MTISQEAKAVLDEIGQVVVGRTRTLRLALAAVLAGGHVLLEDVPGLGKTLIARSLAQALSLDFRRLQCTPDLLPADVTGSFLYDPGSREFEFHQGPVFAGLLLADEINRTPPKTQSALLEAMQERQVTVEGRTFPLPRPFHVLATSNPVEYEGTYPLPEAQLDRFLVRLDIGYPPPEEEVEVLRRRLARQREDAEVAPVLAPGRLAELQAELERTTVDDDLLRYCVDLAVATRNHSSVEVGASPRGAQGLVLVARALATLDDRAYVTPEDVKECAVSVLAHRLVMKPETWTSGVNGVQVVTELLGKVPGPPSS
ncbi:AAA family ATPase [Lentzea flaviverrucosa]|uniref:MoxR-like ATPase n=1 Tax=Lentzea flaviverrucosa TaxID=200379 RepID=A0A1H9MCW8_9PSEU|nr:MoxR family ATPase [Lentzea flaviverrucosa]RDI30965.1 MoxR-like ATPase [Lentzea flaviverrucosa]SER21610.1 MoxR-like ATPase [Lentzea flaviverrucosa]